MSLSRVPEIPRAFAEWGTEQVVQWLGTLQLSRDYAKQFRDHNIDGPALLRLNPSSLSSLGITDSLDRVKLLQQITTMQADLASLAAPSRRWRGLGKFRRYSDNTPVYRTLTAPPSRRISTEERKPQRGGGMSTLTLSRPTVLDGYPSQQNRMRTQSVHSFSGTNSSTSGTLYSVADTTGSIIGTSHSDIGVPRSESALAHSLTRMAYSDVGMSPSRSTEGRGGEGVLLRRRSSHTRDKKKRLSRSMDKLWEAQLSGSPLPLVADVPARGTSQYHSPVPFHDNLAHQESVSVRLHNAPQHRASASLQFYDGIPYEDGVPMRLHENSRLVEILREENATLKRELEAYYQRVCKLMRMEQELERLREAHRLLEESNRRREKLEAVMRSKLESEIAQLRAEVDDGSLERRLERKDSVASKRGFHRDSSGEQPPVSDIHSRAHTEETEVYSQRIDRLKEHLQSLQLMSVKREELERRVRTQLQDEIRDLRGREGAGGKEEGEGEDGGTTWETEVAVLQADLAKWEQRCTELAAEKELAVEVALAQKESHITQLKQALAAKEEEVKELMEKNQRCSCEASRHASPLHKAHSSPSQKSPPHTSPSHPPPHHQLHTSPTSQLSPSHRKTASPTPTYLAHTHKLHTSPPHQLYTSPTKKTGSMLDLSRGSSTSPSSSLINESHSDSHVPRPYLTNGGVDPTIVPPSVGGGGGGEFAQTKPSPLPPDGHHSTSTTQPLNNSVPINPSNPRHVVRRVKSKTPPPQSEVSLLPHSYKYSSLERGPPVSHTPLELQLFNTLLGDAVPGGPVASGRGVNSSGKHSLKGVNTLYSHHHGNRV